LHESRIVAITAALAIALLAGSPAPGAEVAWTGPPEGTAAWRLSQKLLARPATALAAGVEAWERGNRRRADWLLGAVAERYPLIADHADAMRARVLLELGRSDAAVTVARAALEAHPDTLLRPELLAVEGDALARRGDEAEARIAWRGALDETREESLRASLLLATAASQERTGEVEEAIGTYRALWRLYPLSDEAPQAGSRLDELQRSGAEPLREASDWRERADSLYKARRNPEALAAYERALDIGLSTSLAARARHRRARTFFRMRRYPEAVQAFANLPQSDDVPIWHARSLARADRVPEAIAAFERIAEKRRGSNALRARFLAALLLDGRGETERSRRYLESLTRSGGGSSVRRASLWRLGWRAYQEGRHSEAISFLDPLIEEEEDPIGGLRSRYWRARALENLAKRSVGGGVSAAEAARREFTSIALAYPLTYYGWRARSRLPREPARLFVQAASEEQSHRPAPPSSGKRRLSADALARIRILLEAGLDDRALAELSRASARVGGLSDRLELAQLFRNAGNFRSAQRLVVDPYQEALARGPLPTLEELWWHAWPAAFLELVEEATRAPGSVKAALVFSIMREESGFRPKVVSPVGARGLLQIMEPTGERLAKAVGHENFSADDLFEPRTNIRLGTHYLGELLARFDGRMSAAIASYNAGPEAVQRWLEERARLEDDEWIESIPYDQTRSYVKRVLRSLQAYELLYSIDSIDSVEPGPRRADETAYR
jgi:soluble lytic murein transglycosylase